MKSLSVRLVMATPGPSDLVVNLDAPVVRDVWAGMLRPVRDAVGNEVGSHLRGHVAEVIGELT